MAKIEEYVPSWFPGMPSAPVARPVAGPAYSVNSTRRGRRNLERFAAQQGWLWSIEGVVAKSFRRTFDDGDVAMRVSAVRPDACQVELVADGQAIRLCWIFSAHQIRKLFASLAMTGYETGWEPRSLPPRAGADRAWTNLQRRRRQQQALPIHRCLASDRHPLYRPKKRRCADCGVWWCPHCTRRHTCRKTL